MRVVLLALSCLACGDKAPDSGAPADTGADTAASVDDDRAGVYACLAERWVADTCSGCHLDLRFDALETLLTTDRELHPGPIVIPGDPDDSLLVRKVEAKVGLVTLEEGEGAPMPMDTDITVEDAQLIRDWVATGALLPSGC
jgi:hypothetical protein